jgi:hypothetical protein
MGNYGYGIGVGVGVGVGVGAVIDEPPKEPVELPKVPSRDSIGYKYLQEKLKQLKDELIDEAIKEYEIVDQISDQTTL